MVSNGPGKISSRPPSASALRSVTRAPSVRQFSAAIASAASDRSAAQTSAPGSASARLAAMQPLPVPTSSRARALRSSCTTQETSSSVSGRGSAPLRVRRSGARRIPCAPPRIARDGRRRVVRPSPRTRRLPSVRRGRSARPIGEAPTIRRGRPGRCSAPHGRRKVP